jgi:hypothetical protein
MKRSSRKAEMNTGAARTSLGYARTRARDSDAAPRSG